MAQTRICIGDVVVTEIGYKGLVLQKFGANLIVLVKTRTSGEFRTMYWHSTSVRKTGAHYDTVDLKKLGGILQ